MLVIRFRSPSSTTSSPAFVRSPGKLTRLLDRQGLGPVDQVVGDITDAAAVAAAVDGFAGLADCGERFIRTGTKNDVGGPGGTVRAASFDPDYTHRPEPEVILEDLAALET